MGNERIVLQTPVILSEEDIDSPETFQSCPRRCLECGLKFQPVGLDGPVCPDCLEQLIESEMTNGDSG